MGGRDPILGQNSSVVIRETEGIVTFEFEEITHFGKEAGHFLFFHNMRYLP